MGRAGTAHFFVLIWSFEFSLVVVLVLSLAMRAKFKVKQIKK